MIDQIEMPKEAQQINEASAILSLSALEAAQTPMAAARMQDVQTAGLSPANVEKDSNGQAAALVFNNLPLLDSLKAGAGSPQKTGDGWGESNDSSTEGQWCYSANGEQLFC